jgi:hypothetical protein
MMDYFSSCPKMQHHLIYCRVIRIVFVVQGVCGHDMYACELGRIMVLSLLAFYLLGWHDDVL